MSETPIYIRIKRKNQTFCFLCQKQDTINSIKQRIASCWEQHPLGKTESVSSGSDSMRLLLSGDFSNSMILQNENTLDHYGNDIKDNAVLHLVLALSDDDEEYEAVDVDNSTDIQQA